MSIRKAEVGDVAKVVELNGGLFREDAGSRDPFANPGWPEEEGHEYFSALISGGDCVCFLAESGGEAVGYLAGRLGAESTRRPANVAELESMYVREGCRSFGVGASLADGFFCWAAGKGAERVSVTAYAANGRAIKFYESLGFRPMRLSLETKV